MIAAQKRSAVVVDLLVEAGAKVGARDRQGRTALMYAAAYNRDAAVVDILLRSGAQAGEATLTASCPGVPELTVTITVQ